MTNTLKKQSSPRRARGEALDLACERLLQVARTLGPDARMPSLRTLHEEIGVSPGTLNLALSRLEKQRVLVRRERSGVFVAPRIGQRNVSLICSPDFFLQSSVSPFWQLLIEHIHRLARDHDTHLTMGFSHPSLEERASVAYRDASSLPDSVQTEITSGNVHGVLAIGLSDEAARWIEAQGVPVVAFAGAARYIVNTSRLALIQQGVTALARAGCRRIDLWEPRVNYWLDQRMLTERTFAAALSAFPEVRGRVLLPPGNAAKGLITAHQTPKIETGWDYAFHYFGKESDLTTRPDGILIVDDMLTLGAMMAFPHLGVTLRKDVQVATYANAGSPVLLGWHDSLFRIEYDLSELVGMLYETLEALMENGRAAAAGEYVPELPYETPEMLDAAGIPERHRLVRPHLIVPTG